MNTFRAANLAIHVEMQTFRAAGPMGAGFHGRKAQARKPEARPGNWKPKTPNTTPKIPPLRPHHFFFGSPHKKSDLKVWVTPFAV